jgi:endo-1,4-beta-xylanase
MIVRSEMAMTRRLILRAAVAGAASAPFTLARAKVEEAVSLRKAAERAGLQFGSTSDVGFRAVPPEYAELFTRNCGLFAPQIGWSKTAPRQFDPDPSWEDPNIAFAREHQMGLTGGHLLWHETTPSWFEQLPTRSAAEQAVTRHIEAMTKLYGPMTYSWNVVNEAIDPRDGRPDGLRESQLEQSAPRATGQQ